MSRYRKNQKMKLSFFIPAVVFMILMYIIGYSQGQANAYSKIKDDKVYVEHE